MKKLAVSLIDHTPGAVYVTKDTGGFYNHVWPASIGVKKVEGCVAFEPTHTGVDHDSFAYSDKQCDQVYFDHCDSEEAWLVLPRPKGRGYWWIQVDHKLELQDEY